MALEDILLPKQTKGNPFIVRKDANGNYYCNFRFEDANGNELGFYLEDIDNNKVIVYLDNLPVGTTKIYLRQEPNVINKVKGNGPQPLSGNEKTISLSLGVEHSGCLTETGKVYMRGQNNYGQLGDGTTTNKLVPTLIPQSRFYNEKVVSLSLGAEHSGCITETGKLYMWGNNSYGQLGVGTTNKSVPTLIPQSAFNNEKVVSLSLGRDHSGCITETGKLYMWGSNGNGRLGDGTTIAGRYVPTLIPQSAFNNEKVAALSLGVYHSGCITATGKVYMWGSNGNGRLGDGTTTQRNAPTLIPQSAFNNEKVAALSLGVYHSGCITETGKVYMWGYNGDGRLGDGTTTQRNVPTLIPQSAFNNEKVVSLSVGGGRNGGITATGKVYMWGTIPTLIPQSAFNNEKVISLSLGGGHNGGITATGKLYMWGSNNRGQLGTGDTISYDMPRLVINDTYPNTHVQVVTFLKEIAKQ